MILSLSYMFETCVPLPVLPACLLSLPIPPSCLLFSLLPSSLPACLVSVLPAASLPSSFLLGPSACLSSRPIFFDFWFPFLFSSPFAASLPHPIHSTGLSLWWQLKYIPRAGFSPLHSVFTICSVPNFYLALRSKFVFMICIRKIGIYMFLSRYGGWHSLNVTSHFLPFSFTLSARSQRRSTKKETWCSVKVHLHYVIQNKQSAVSPKANS